MVDFLFALIELPLLSAWFRSYEAKCVQLGCFRRGRPLCTQILPGQGRPKATILGNRKLKTLGYPTVRLHPSAFPHFDTIPECDGQTDIQTYIQTDRRICRSIYSACKASCAEHCKNSNIALLSIKLLSAIN